MVLLGIVLCCVFFGCLAFLEQLLKSANSLYERHVYALRQDHVPGQARKLSRVGFWMKVHFLSSLLFTVRFVLSYFVMLAAMSFNVYIFIAIVGGAFCGNLLFNFLIVPSSPSIVCNDVNCCCS